ncbi:MAG: prepilin-type N-terminal cleavage/methylation domain-containing protein [Phycisphaeraceae bacterium]|nr:prepilin-type N-terminal cleavage/methylation domain-containing protein [Phycisphaeraceae bacterium]
MNQPTPITPTTRRQAAGFTLAEILIALGVFAIGMIAVASLFPAAAILQRETTQDVIGELAAQSAAAIVNAQPLTYEWTGAASNGDLADYYTHAGLTATDVVPLEYINVTGGTALDRFPVTDRSYPSAQLDLSAGPLREVIADCDLYWVPFIQDINGDPANTSPGKWIMRIFILEADSRATYADDTGDANLNGIDSFPKVRRVDVSSVSGNIFTLAGTAAIETGDIVMDSNGNDHVVTNVNGTQVAVLNTIARSPDEPNRLWFAPRLGGTASPAQRVITVDARVVAP